jgi:methenyltetrahydromethanopterin cyclohydrolase
MTELFTMIVLAANIVAASAFAKFAPMVADVAAAHEQFSDANTFEGRVVAKIQTRNARSAVLRDIGESTGAYWGSPLF